MNHTYEIESAHAPWEAIIDVGKKLEDSANMNPTQEQQQALKKSALTLVTAVDKLIPNHHTILI